MHFWCFYSTFPGFLLLFRTRGGGGWGGGLNSVRPSHILSSAHLRAGNDDDHDHDHSDEDCYHENNDKILLMTVIMMLLKTMMTVAMMMKMSEMIKAVDDGNGDDYVHDCDHYDDD